MAERIYRQSDMSTYIHCRRRAEWETYRRLEIDWGDNVRDAKTKDTGSLVHAAIQAYGQLRPWQEEIVAKAKLWSGLDDPTTDKEHGWKAAIEYAIRMVEGWFEWLEDEGVMQGKEVVEQEERFIVTVGEFHGDLVKVTFKPDMLLRMYPTGTLNLNDVKTVDDLVSVMDYNVQLMRYAVLYRLHTGERIERLSTFQLKRSKRTKAAKPPFYRYAEHFISEEEYDQAYDEMMQTLAEMVEHEQAVERGEKHLSLQNRSTLCGWMCGVSDLCDCRNRAGNEEHLIQFNYRVKENPLDL